jgi:ATP-binding cassette subfamily B protein
MTTIAAQLKDEEYSGQISWRVWRRVLGFARPHRASLIGLIASSVWLAGMDAVMPLVTRGMVNEVVAKGAQADLPPYCFGYGVLVVLFGVGTWVFIRLAGVVSTGMAHDIRRDAFRRLQELSFSYHDRRPVGWLVARLTGDCDRLSRIIAWGSIDLCWGVCLIATVTVLMLVLNWKLALVVLTVLPPMTVVSIIFQRRILAASRKVRRINSAVTASYSESIMGVRTTKTLVRESENLGEFQGLTGEMFAASVRNAILEATYFPLILQLGSIAGGLALWVGGVRVISGDITIGDLLAFIAYTDMFMYPIQELARVIAQAQAAQAAAERVTGLIDTEPEIQDSPEVRSATARRGEELRKDPGGGAGLAPDGLADRIDEVEFRNVSFAYRQGKEVLRGFNLKVRPGQTVALVGPTGGGKSTIVSLMCRFYEPLTGEILINGVDYRRRSLHWLQSNLGIVLQTPHLFGGTIRQNIRYGNLQADDEQVEQAARLVNAHEFITRCEKGYDTEVGEGGNRLATGQKQLVAFARAILADPQIFVMDEATSSVDTQTERLIQRGLAKVLEGRINFIIAHRLSTIRSADVILVIEKGRVVEQGNHDELIRLGGHYYELYTNQFTEQRQDELMRAAARGDSADNS